ncbi:hypothetical protein ACIA2T_01015 [Amycolatopsis japonica]
MIRKMMLVGGAMISALVLGTSTAEAATGYRLSPAARHPSA